MLSSDFRIRRTTNAIRRECRRFPSVSHETEEIVQGWIVAVTTVSHTTVSRE
jgi:hypothetical protein